MHSMLVLFLLVLLQGQAQGKRVASESSTDLSGGGGDTDGDASLVGISSQETKVKVSETTKECRVSQKKTVAQLINGFTNKKDVLKSRKPCFVAVLGPTGSGKYATQLAQIEALGLNSPATIIIDDLVEHDAGYKSKVKSFTLTEDHLGGYKMKIDPYNTSQDVKNKFTHAYFTARKCGCVDYDGCVGCDTVNDETFYDALEERKDVVFESTGDQAYSLQWPVGEVGKRGGEEEYEIIASYNVVRYADLTHRIEHRTEKQFGSFRKDPEKSPAPRLPDKYDLATYVNNIVVAAKELIECALQADGCFFTDRETKAQVRLFHKLYIFDNTGSKESLSSILVTNATKESALALLDQLKPPDEEVARSQAYHKTRPDPRKLVTACAKEE